MEVVLVVEDDQRLANHVKGLLRNVGMAAVHVPSITELEECLDSKQQFQAILLDRLLCGTDTKNFVPRLRKKWPLIPLMVLSAINTPLERAELLNLGADDYLGKPFLSQELIARIKALMRRVRGEQSNYREVCDVVLDLQKRILIRLGRQEGLPAKEFLLFRTLSDEVGRVLSKNELLDLIWSGALDIETNVVESTVANLRKRLSNIDSSIQVRNARNAGYWIEG